MSRKREFQPQYAGDRSRLFWRAVNGTGDAQLYELGCELQSLEGKMLRLLMLAQRRKADPTP